MPPTCLPRVALIIWTPDGHRKRERPKRDLEKNCVKRYEGTLDGPISKQTTVAFFSGNLVCKVYGRVLFIALLLKLMDRKGEVQVYLLAEAMPVISYSFYC